MDTRTSGMLPNNLRTLEIYKGPPVNPENLSNNEFRNFMNRKLFLRKKKKGSLKKRPRKNNQNGGKTKRVKRKSNK
jgi:hypothetical protein